MGGVKFGRPLAKSSGFTLVELMIGLVVAGLAAIAAVGVFSAQNRASASNHAQVDAQQNARAAMDLITRELRQAGINTDTFHKQNTMLDAAPYQVMFSGDVRSGVDSDGSMPTTSTAPRSDGTNYVPGNFQDENLDVLTHFNNGAETVRLGFDSNNDGAVTLADSMAGTAAPKDFELVREVNGDVDEVAASGLRGPVARADGSNPPPLFQYWGLFAGSTTLKLWGDTNGDGKLSSTEIAALTSVSKAELKNIREITVSVEAVSDDEHDSASAHQQQHSTILTSTIRPRNVGLNASSLNVCGSPPSAPTSLSAIDTPEDGGRSITLTFGASYDDLGGENDVAEYTVYRRKVGQSSFGAPIYNVKSTNASSYTFINDESNSKRAEDAPVDGIQYEYFVSSWDCGPSESNPSDVAGPVMSEPNGPQPPAITQANDTPCDTGGDITVSFTASTDDVVGQSHFTGYRLYRGTSSNITAYKVRVKDITATNAPSYSVHDITNSLIPMSPDSAYYYVARAVRWDVESVDSNQWGPVQVSDGVAQANLRQIEDMPADFGQRLQVDWDASPSEVCVAPHQVANYYIFRRSQHESMFSNVGVVAATNRSTYTYPDTMLTPGVTYTYYVRSEDSSNEHTDSNTLSGLGTAENQLLPPVAFTAADDPCDPNGAIVVSFNASPSDAAGDITEYRIYRGTSSGSYNYELAMVPAHGQSSYTATDDITHSGANAPQLGTTYYYVAKSYNSYYTLLSSPTSESSALAEATPTSPKMTSSVDTPLDGGRSITVVFNRSDHDGSCDNTVTQYKVYRGTTPGSISTLVGTMVALRLPTYTFLDDLVNSLSAPVDGTPYYYAARAYAGSLVSKLSNVAGPATSVHDGSSVVVIWSDNFESDQGWTTGKSSGTNNWQRATPAGLWGTTLGFADPAAAVSGTKVIGTKLTGTTGVYSRSSAMWYRSPKVDCRSASQVKLAFKRWLNVERNSRDTAEIWVRSKNNGWTRLWQNPSTAVTDNGWNTFTLDISSVAGGQDEVQVEFDLNSNSSNDYTGWNIDDLELQKF